jgi:uncharacterized protein (DUF2249 family)
MKLSSDPDFAKFRTLSFRLVKEATEHKQLLESIDKGVAEQIIDIQNELNTELSKKYNGNYKFDLCIDEGNNLDILKIKRKQAKALSMMCHEANDKLSKIKRFIETKMSNDTDI